MRLFSQTNAKQKSNNKIYVGKGHGSQITFYIHIYIYSRYNNDNEYECNNVAISKYK